MNDILHNPAEGAEAILEIMSAGAVVSRFREASLARADQLTDEEWQGLRDRLQRWLEDAHHLATQFKPQSYSVAIGTPFSATVSFSWSGEATK